MKPNYVDVVVVGAGAAGLTAAAYVSKENHSVVLIEKDKKSGGLLGAFSVDGHILDQGARGLIDSGIVFPMMKQLGIDVPMLKNPIKITIGDESISLIQPSDIDGYGELLKKNYPNNKEDIDHIIADIKYVMKAMDVLYGIENPLFLPKPYDMKYITKTLLPWMVKFIFNINKAMKLFDPINQFLKKRTDNTSLINIITQHFFAETPTFFALSYFTLYMEYHYPKGSTQSLVDQLVTLINQQNGTIINGVEVVSIDPQQKKVQTSDGQYFFYNQLIWAADMNFLYKIIDTDTIKNTSLKQQVIKQREFINDKQGSDSVLSLYMLVDQEPSTFASSSGPHCFYTEKNTGLSKINLDQIKDENGTFTTNIDEIFIWLQQYVTYNTFEISIPSLRDPSLSPKGQTGIIVSILFDFKLTKHIADLGYYEQFKKYISDIIVDHFDHYYWPGIQAHTTKTIVASPLTVHAQTNNTEGSLTGWSFINKPFPVDYHFLRVSKSVLTPIKSIKQAGQWTFNPAGVPVAILTGKLAADAVLKDLKKSKG